MLTQRLRVIVVLFTLSAAAIVACSSPPPLKKATPTAPGNTNTSESNDTTSSPPASPPVVAPVALPDAGLRALPDASLQKPPVDAPKPPAPTTKFCIALSQCCGTLPDMFQVLTCGGTSVLGNEDACGVELALCQAGGIDTSGLGDDVFGQSNPQCSTLAKCCDNFQTQGYTETANDCSGWVEIQDETSCQTQLQSYQSYGECQ